MIISECLSLRIKFGNVQKIKTEIDHFSHYLYMLRYEIDEHYEHTIHGVQL